MSRITKNSLSGSANGKIHRPESLVVVAAAAVAVVCDACDFVLAEVGVSCGWYFPDGSHRKRR
ncbi:unnamed protein product [Ilex paraguariensis]|uniref:Uncharacterized protein n=1 Tax=Ilex paraguariensis TaxID=185542 RepID=A0ABC8RME5_9AQUA